MGCFVRGGKNGMGCFVRGDKNCMGCFVRGGKLMRDVLSGVAKNGMGCFVPGCFVLHSRKPVYSKGADQPAHPRSLIRAFFIRFLESIIYILAWSEISIF